MRLLIRHFFRRFFDSDLIGREENSESGVGAILAVLAVPGALMSFVLFGKYSSLMRWFRPDIPFDPVIASVPDKYTFLAFTMTLTGVVAVLKWDGLFPDRRDYANLAPLPISASAIFISKSAALALFVGLFVVDINAVSSVFFPLIVLENRGTFGELVRFVVAHAVSLGAASLFAFTTVMAVIGCLMTILPYSIFRRITRYVQFGVAAGLLLLFFSVPAITPVLLRADAPWWIYLLPPVWFVELYTSIQGEAQPVLALVSGVAPQALLLSAASAGLFYAFSYRTYFLRTAEAPEILTRTSRVPEFIFAGLDGWFLRSPSERASFRFAFRTLFRSDRHCAVLAGALGLGTALAVQSAASVDGGNRPTSSELSQVLTILFFLITGMRLAFGVPSDLRANWTLAVAGVAPMDPRTLTAKVVWAIVTPVLAVFFVLHSVVWGTSLAGVHIGYAVLLSAFLINVALIGFRGMPYTKPDMPGSSNFVRAIAFYAAGYVVFSRGLAGLESWMLVDAPRWGVFFFFGLFIWLGLRQLRETDDRSGYESGSGELLQLRLSE